MASENGKAFRWHSQKKTKGEDMSQTKKTQNRSGNGVSRKARTVLRYYDYNLLAGVVLLTCFGLVMIYSTSAYQSRIENNGNDMYYFMKQARISAVCLVGALIFSQIDYHKLMKYAPWLYVAANGLMMLTKFAGRESHGATRWLYIGPISIQTAEIAKVAVILFLPMMIVKLGRNVRNLKGLAVILLLGAVPAFFAYYFTNNLSTALIIMGIAAFMIYVVYPKTKIMTAAGIGILVAGYSIARYIGMSLESSGKFRLRRLMVWIDPEAYPDDGGYQVLQGLYAIGSGGFFGKGLGNSTQKLSALPEAQNDMIFAIICEELGVFGAAMLTLMFVFLLYRLLFIAQNAPDLLGSLIVTGIFAHIALQAMLNIMVVLNVIPTTGVTLPFVSYGGTAVVFLMSEITLALSVSRQIRFKEEREETGG